MLNVQTAHQDAVPNADVLGQAQTIAAIDVGSNSIRMAIAQVLPDGRIEVLERLQRAVHLGQDTFRKGRLGGRSMRAAVSILRDYQRALAEKEVKHIRAVATSAVREAGNADTFLDRVLMATGLDVAIIDTAEESRLLVSALRQSIGGNEAVLGKHAIVAEVGGGSTLLTIMHEGEIATYQSLRLGSIRLQESIAGGVQMLSVQAELMEHQINNVITAVQTTLPLKSVGRFFAVGGDARFAAEYAGKKSLSADLNCVSADDLQKLIESCCEHTPEELAKLYGRPFVDTETINPALQIYRELLMATRARKLIVSSVSMRDGLLLDVARSVTGKEDEVVAKGITHSAMTLARKYRVDIKHAEYVADLSLLLFDGLQGEHRLSIRHRLLLRLAALLHDIGAFINGRAHHKHSYYVIANSEVFGLTRRELQMVAHIARYHRRSMPKPSHADYMRLPREDRMIVSRLAAILRVADALDDGRNQQIRDFHCEIQGEELVVYVRGVADLNMERRAVLVSGDLFEDIYGLRIRLEQQ